ncbi:ATP-binding protein [Aestuariivirga sp.]|uniref:two-component system sensor histidine kinase NtrB n=1 Tax=Aestuariivirga sp. TaxID=2650926 RepID=UPI0025C1E1E1|nr:ATP-binding protein [Aestuariivirga sp.]MCA3554908.1 PAS domain-containing protein [Aestuariivirga sp.]
MNAPLNDRPPAPDAPMPKAVVDALPNPLIVLDEACRIRLANVAAEDYFQASSNMLLRHKLSDLVPFSSPVFGSIAQARASAGVVNEYSLAVGTPRLGGERLVDVQATLMHDDPRYVILMLLERSMAHKIDRQLTSRGAARSVSGMATMLAHEIKNPLAGIRGAAQLLEPALNSDDRALARLICEETDRIRDLVDQMEVFSDERPLEKSPVNIHAVLERVKRLTTASMGEGVSVREDYDPSLPPVLGNKDQLVQVFLNLAKNAAEAIGNNAQAGEILLTTAFRPGIRLTVPGSSERITLPLEVCVHDTGPGVPEELRPNIFDPFVTTKPGGKGLGLALVAKIVRDHGGIIECADRGRGATFRVLLPMLRGAAAPRDFDGDDTP